MEQIYYIFGGLIIALVVYYRFIFLRDNKNRIPKGDNIVAPASGKVFNIQTISPNSPLTIKKKFLGKIHTSMKGNEKFYLINIFMTPFDVHYTKMPYPGKIIDITLKKGKFMAANSFQAALENESQEFLLETAIGQMKVIQISGFLARTARSFISKNTYLQKGDKMGVILLGSQVALIFPEKNFELNIKVGDKVSAGESIICKIS